MITTLESGLAVIEKDIAAFKLGSDLVADAENGVHLDLAEHYCEQIAEVKEDYHPLLIVGGSVNTGTAFLKAHGIDETAFDEQELSAIGTAEVSVVIRDMLMKNHGIVAGQVLANTKQLKRGSTLSRGLLRGISRGMVYDINENDQENTYELIRFMQEQVAKLKRRKPADAHNDKLAEMASVALLQEMKDEKTPENIGLHLVMFTEIGGFVVDKAVQAEISASDRQAVYQKCNGVSAGGTGGMRAKTEACFNVFDAGAKSVTIAAQDQKWRNILRGQGEPGKVTRVVQ